MSIKGNLESFSLGEIFQSLSMNQHTGTLRVSDGSSEKRIYFSRGEVHLLSTGGGETTKLGDYLIKDSITTPEQIQAALKDQQESGKLLGEILIEQNIITHDELRNALRYKIEEEIYDLFLWQKADFEFISNYLPPDMEDPLAKATELSLNTNGLIMESLRRIDEWQRIHQAIPEFYLVFQQRNLNPNLLERIDLPDTHKEELRIIDGIRSVNELLTVSRLNKFELCTLLYEYLRHGVISHRKKEEYLDLAEKLLKGRKWARAEKFFRNALYVDPDDSNLRLVFANLLKAHHKLPEAFTEYRNLAAYYIEHSQPDKAATALRLALELEPRNTDVLAELFKALELADRIEEARRTAEKLGYIFKQELDFHQAIEYYQRLVAWAPDNVEHFIQLAECYRSLNHKEYACRYYETAAEKLIQNEEFIEAAKMLKIVLSLDPSKKDIRSKLAMVNRSQRRKEKVLTRRLIIAGIIVIGAAIVFTVYDYISSSMRLSDILARKDELVKKEEFDTILYELRSARPIIPYLPTAATIKEETDTIMSQKKEYREKLSNAAREQEKHIDWVLEGARKDEDQGELRHAYKTYYRLHTEYPDVGKVRRIRVPLRVESSPPGAKIFLGEKEIGATPSTIKYSPREAGEKIHIKLDGYTMRTFPITFGEFQNISLAFMRIPLWKYRVISPLSADPLLNASRVYATLKNGSVVCLETRSGKLDWQTQAAGAAGERLSAPWVSNRSILLATGTNKLVKLDTAGRIARKYFIPTATDVTPVPLEGNPLILFVAGDGKGYFIRSSDGGTERRVSYDGKVAAAPVCRENAIYFGTAAGKLYGLDYYKEGFDFELQVDGPLLAPGVIHGGLLFIGSTGGTLYAIDLEKNEEAWTARLGGGILTAPVVTASHVIAADDACTVRAFIKKTGKEAWTARLGKTKSVHALALGREGVYAAGPGGLVALDASSGEELWRYPAEKDDPFLPYVGTIPGKVLLATKKGRLILLWEEKK
jgi:outer membrane protein assembly factor BamB/Tfp pilus assembly protein PilF